MKKQKKQNLLTAIIIVLTIALIMMLGSIVYEEVINMNKQEKTTVQDKIDTTDKEEAPIENEPEEEIPTETEKEEKEEFVEEEEKNNDKKAIDLAKKEWGEDDTVTFNIEEKKGTKYYVAVKRNASTVAWYEVDTTTWEISEF